MKVISNSSPLIGLSRINRLDILQQIFGPLLILDAVYHEIIFHCPNHLEKGRLQHAIDTFIEIGYPRRSHVFSRHLGHGECAVLSLALEHHPDIVLIDDKRARYEAQELGFIPTFTTDVLKEAEHRHLITSYRETVQELYEQAIYLPE